jgi:hypothetical protein
MGERRFATTTNQRRYEGWIRNRGADIATIRGVRHVVTLVGRPRNASGA